MGRRLLVSTVGLFVIALASAPASWGSVQLYVSPQGSNAWPGTEAQPLSTLHRAQQRVRELTPSQSASIVVNLRAGTYFLNRPLNLRAARGDSGQNGHRVIYQAYGYGGSSQEHVVVSGGQPVSGWTAAGGGVWQAEVGALDTRQLYVNGERARRASLGTGLPGDVTVTEEGYVTDSVAPQSWENPEDIELVYKGGFGQGTWPWAETRCGIASISGDASSTTITMDQPCYGVAQALYSIPVAGPPAELGAPTNVENSKSFLTQPGTFYLDKTTPGDHHFYYRPRPAEVMASAQAVAARLETLISGRGTETEALHEVTLRGLTFAHATWLGPDAPSGFVNALASLYSDPTGELAITVPSNVTFRRSDRIRIEGNRFEKLGGGGLEISDSSSDNLIRGNVFTDISDGAIQLGVVYPQSEGVNADNRVTDNWVHAIGVEYRGAAGIVPTMTQNSVVAHNQINDVPYTGIFSGPADDIGQDITVGNQILGNRVFDVMKVMDDGGGIYVRGEQGDSLADGAVVRGNAVYGGPPPKGNVIAIYLDDTTSWITVKDNAMFDYQIATGGCVDPFIKNVKYVGNFWDTDGPEWLCDNEPENVTLVGNTKLEGDPQSACEANAGCAAILEGAGLRPEYQHLLSE